MIINFERPEKPAQEKTCNCKNSKCMKLYCQCYSAGLECNKNCRCLDCRNKKQGETPHINQSNPSVQIIKALKFDGMKQSKGCSCRKSSCIKKYCECFQEKLFCGEYCKCRQCKNNELMSNRNIITTLKQPKSISNTNRNCSLYPIMLSQSSQHINHMINEQNSLNIEDNEMEEEIATLFQYGEGGKVDKIIESFINILKKIDNKAITEKEQEIKQQLSE